MNDLFPQLVDLDRDRVRHFVTGQLESLLANQLGDLQLGHEVGPLVGGKVERAFRQQGDELFAKLRDAVAGDRADRMQRVELAEL